MVFTAEIDTTKPPQKLIKPAALMELSIPSSLPEPARQVLIRLFTCFARHKEVKESLIGELLWGFAIPTVEFIELPPEYSLQGLNTLRNLGYAKYQAKDGEIIDEFSDKIGSAWLRYEKKLLDMVYEGRQ
jgi:hypothetical protein